ncbi:unnamed protein product [Peronospora belbahrii]|uniref:Uncharacterized protein n=1 Tax=Peronospora belbahrii TaxID=622444 RepID=A0AAU9KRV2_9STRA|nr:unnamed protein product [Peronospora belbahrii]
MRVIQEGSKEDKAKQWKTLLTSVQLPSNGGQKELQKALERLQEEEEKDAAALQDENKRNLEHLRQEFFAMRRAFFQVRIELFHVAQNLQHVHVQIAQEIVNKLLQEGLEKVLVDELYGRQFYHAPVFDRVGKEEQKARMEWEIQFLQEEMLLRDLFLLTLVVSKQKTRLDCAMKITTTVYNWEARVMQEVLTTRTLALPATQQWARKLTQVGVLIAIRLLHTTGTVQEYETLQRMTTDFFLTELGDESIASSVSGVLLLAWAALLGRQFRNIVECDRESEKAKGLQEMLETTLAATERFRSFYYFNALMRSLIFCIEHVDSDEMERKPYLMPMSFYGTLLWTLPNVAASGGLCGANTIQSQQPISFGSAFAYQNVVADFLNDMLSSLGYMDSIDGVQQLFGMVKFVLPALSSARVAKQTLGIDLDDGNVMDAIAGGETTALCELLTKARAYLPHSLLPCIQMMTALCYNNQNYSSPTVIRQVLKYFSTPRAGLEDDTITSGVYWPLPPTEYFTELDDEPGRLKCTRTFAYDGADGQLVVPAGTVGTIMYSSDVIQVKWLVLDGGNGKNAFSLWDMLLVSADSFVAGLQSGSFVDLYRTNSEDLHVLTSFFEFIVQLGRHQDGGKCMVEEMECRWGEARLRRWWIDHQLPSPEIYVSLLFRQQIALPTLLSASRENLVSWGIKDRYTREQILVLIGGTGSLDFEGAKIGLTYGDTTSKMTLFGVDGGTHLLRLLLKVLEWFLHRFSWNTDDNTTESENAGLAEHLHLFAASFVALRTVLATTSGVKLLINSSLCGRQEECINLIVKSAKKLFELQERLVGEYPVVLATHDIFMSVVRWFLSMEAQSLASQASGKDKFYSHEFVASERLWFVSAAEFAIEVLSTHEGWKFLSITNRCEITERCFRLLYVLVLPRKCVNERNDMLISLESALRETLSTDMSMLMKLLRSSCAVLSSKEDDMGHWNIVMSSDFDEESGVLSSDKNYNDCFPLKYKSAFDNAGASMMQLESLVTTCLRFVALLITNQSNAVDVPIARKILLASIDGRSSKKRKLLTIVTLCGGYLGYLQEQAPGIAYWSLQILQHAAVALDYREERESRNLSSMHSLIALFHGYQDLGIVRGVFAQLLQVSSTQQSALRKAVIEMLTLCLEHQPGFLALLLFGDKNTRSSNSENTTKEKVQDDFFPFVTLLERFFEASERLLEQASDLFCALLTFLVHVWKGAIQNRLDIHQKVLTALCARPAFWFNVTRALKIHMPLESADERGLLDMELAAATAQGMRDAQSMSSSLEAYVGRSSAYGYMARSLILQLVSYEWHSHASTKDDHPLLDVLESFRKEGLFSHWLRTFTRLDYSPAQFELYASSIWRACNSDMLTTSLFSDIPASGISMYVEGLICNTSTLRWQLSAGGDFKLEASATDVRVLKMIQWSNLQAAFLHAQLFSLSKWKVFMELCCLQAGGAADSTPIAEKSSEATTSRRLKRKESMISSPPRNSSTSRTPTTGINSRVYLVASGSSTSSSESALLSRFFGDRTSFEMVRVLADVIKIRLHEAQDEALDYFVLLYLHDLVQLLVSMLHHQLCLVVQKARDPKLSQTRQRLEVPSAERNLKLNVGATLELLAVVEKTISAVRDSMEQSVREVDLVGLGANTQLMSGSSVELTSVSLISRMVMDYERGAKSVTDELLTSLLTAALLLVRHLVKISSHPNIANRTIELESTLPPKSILQMKLIGHCMNIIDLCDGRSQHMKSSEALFQLSWCLFQEALVGCSSVSNVPKLRTINALQLNPLVKKLEHEQQGIGALLYLVVQRFRPSSYSKAAAAKQEEAFQVLRGLVAVVWNPINSELCQRVMLKGSSNSYSPSLISMLATQLLPLLQTQMEREEATSKLRGYILSVRDSIVTDRSTDAENLERSVAHRAWCLVLNFVGGLLRLQTEETVIASDDDVDVWSFMSSAEPLLLSAVELSTCQRLTSATIAEHQALLRLLNALSGTTTRRKRWRQAFPNNTVVLMEQSRQLLRRACVLLGSSSLENDRLRTERMQKKKHGKLVSKSIVGFGASLRSKSPRSPRSPSAFTYAHQTLLHDHLQAVQGVEKRKLTDFYRKMETELVITVQLASLLLTKWTASLTDRDVILVVDGVRRVDEEQLVPLLAFIPPNDARSTYSSPGLGHLCLAMNFILDQLLASEDSQPKELQTAEMKAVLVNAVNACAVLFLKTYLLYLEHYELVKHDRNELDSFFCQFNARLSNDDSTSSIGVDVQLLEYIGKIIAGED